MTATHDAPTATSTASKVPVFSLPQTELLTVNLDDIPMLKDALGPGSHFQPLFLDPEIGVWALMATFAPGVELPIHLHTGTVHGYTISGKWIYKEYPDQPQTAGSYLYEPASSVHTLAVPEDNTESTVILFIIYGANVSFTDDGQFHSVLDAITVMKLTEQLAQAQGLPPVPYITGGFAGLARSHVAP
ncbi:MAG: 2,4'-dihydroxyacetophenone dioxygenase family protein [Rhodococcus sp. (in: high G+C Gram-positive bacteria)]|uniref:2,4'-dihydroxyacetophenone dioxygenase family protein n=1 Tax=Rhodococcus sp. TaxID=1831 RepID=UPI002AD89336|nr:2,4'-dihydroxyacetophenone dioxygenase family protein [Rhodococcus sp. (in: high G+C Gram-positive bacteria)]